MKNHPPIIVSRVIDRHVFFYAAQIERSVICFYDKLVIITNQIIPKKTISNTIKGFNANPTLSS